MALVYCETVLSFSAVILLTGHQGGTCLVAVFHVNPGKPVPECHHSGSYWSKGDGCWFVGGDDLTGALHVL